MTKSKVLVLGGNGFVGRELVAQLRQTSWAEVLVASRSSGGVDTRDAAALARALQGMDAVVNCVAGNGAAIAEGAQVLCAAAAAQANKPRLVHMSTQSVYGNASGGWISESAPLRADIGWYGKAKIDAEAHVHRYATDTDAPTVILRPGCVTGPGSALWLTRVVRWLRAGWIGDLGAGGDGWSNLVHVRDVAHCAVAALKAPLPLGRAAAFNVAAPDSPRWNRYFHDLALQIGATPLRRISPRRLRFISTALGVPLKATERLHLGDESLPPGIPPSLLRLWQQEMRLDSAHASAALLTNSQRGWTTYETTVRECAMSLRSSRAP